MRNVMRDTPPMPQIVVRLEQDLLDVLDRLVADGAGDSRSDVTRRALTEFADRRRRAAVGRAIADEYRERPQTEAEIAWLDSSTAAMIADEPW